jgi:DNA-binding CsgD family transcriptional regulator
MGRLSFPLEAAVGVFGLLFDDLASPAMNLLNRDYTVLWANRGMGEGVQRPLSEIIGKPCYQGFRRRQEPCEPCLFKIVSETKAPLVMERNLDLPKRERQYAEVRAYPVFDDGKVTYLFELITPLTGKKKDEDQRRRYVESLEKALKQLTAVGGETLQRENIAGRGTPLTVRETEVLRLVAKGFSNVEIASILRMSLNTAKTHVKSIFFKLDVTDRTEAAVWAVSHDLI